MKYWTVTASVSMTLITILTICGLVHGIDGAMLTGAIATIAGIGGGVGAYTASKQKYPTWHDERIAKLPDTQRRSPDADDKTSPPPGTP